MVDEDDDDCDGEIMEINDPSELLGKSWTYRIHIKHAQDLLQMSDMAYCQYEFNGEIFATECIEDHTFSPVFNYEFIHHVDCVDQEFIDYLAKPFRVSVFVNSVTVDAAASELRKLYKSECEKLVGKISEIHLAILIKGTRVIST